MAVLKSRNFVTALVWLIVVVIVYLVPDLKPAANAIAAGWTLVIMSLILGESWNTTATVAYNQLGKIVEATPSPKDDEYYDAATKILLVAGVLKPTDDPDNPYKIDISALEHLIRKML